MDSPEKQPKNSTQELPREFREFLIASHNGDKKAGERYDKLIENLREHCGELLLIETIEGHKITNLFSNQEKPEDYIWTKKVQLGIISKEPKIEINFGRISLTGESVSFEIEDLSPHPDEEREIKNLKKEKTIFLHWQDFTKINEPLKKINSLAPDSTIPKIKISIGDEAGQRFQNYPFNSNHVKKFPQNILNHFNTVKT